MVDEARLYAEWEEGEGEGVNASTGLIAARRALNDLHLHLAASGYSEVGSVYRTRVHTGSARVIIHVAHCTGVRRSNGC